MVTRSYLEQRKSALKAEFDLIKGDLKDIRDYMHPRAGMFEEDLNSTKRQLYSTKVINNRAAICRRVLSSGMLAGASSPSRPWMKLAAEDPDANKFKPYAEWLDVAQKTLYAIFHRTSLYQRLPHIYSEMPMFGLSPLGVFEDVTKGITHRTHTLGSYYVAQNAEGDVNTICIPYVLTVGQFAQRFGINKASITVKNLYNQNKFEAKVVMFNLIEPNRGLKIGSPYANGKAFISIHWEENGDSDLIAHIGGYEEFPYMVPRWEPNSDHVYSGSLGMDSLGDCRQLQTQEIKFGVALERMIDPSLQVPSGLKGEIINKSAGGITYVDPMQAGQQGIRELYQVNPAIANMMQDIGRVEGRLEELWYKDLFLMLSSSDRRQMTATEVAERHEEKLLMLGPVLESIHNDLFNPYIDRVFNIAMRTGMLPPPPEGMDGMRIKVEYTSMLAQAQQAIGINAIERYAGFIGSQAAMFPELRHKYDVLSAVDEFAAMSGVPAKINRSNEEVQARVQEDKQAAQQAQQMEMMQQSLQGAKTLSEIDTNSGSALTEMMRGRL